jgi:gluconolactonase
MIGLAVPALGGAWILAMTPLMAGDLIAPDAKLEKLAEGFSFTEGPTSDAQGNVYFTDQPNDRILKWSAAGGLSTFLQPAGRANGMCFDRHGTLFACADEKNELWTLDAKGQKTVLFSQYEGKNLNGPNDVWVHPEGGLYFTDPFYKRAWWTHDKMPQEGQHVYFAAKDSKAPVRVVNDLEQPNGIVGSPDGKRLYVADIRARKTYRFDIQPDGRLENKTLFCELGSDGMTLDSQGNLYLTGRGVTVFNSAGKQIEKIDVAESWTANVCFGGADRKTLFITASKGLYGLRMNVAGNGPGK